MRRKSIIAVLLILALAATGMFVYREALAKTA
ncbi:MAG: hypothetical protein JWN02_1275, partial [Acidobacteria bacterium]|nr:hypothetical protein [Acidobacteriota bacterium]